MRASLTIVTGRCDERTRRIHRTFPAGRAMSSGQTFAGFLGVTACHYRAANAALLGEMRALDRCAGAYAFIAPDCHADPGGTPQPRIEIAGERVGSGITLFRFHKGLG